MTLPGSDPHSASAMPHRPRYAVPSTHSIPDTTPPPFPPPAAAPLSPSSPIVGSGKAGKADHEHAVDFATHSWDLATGGLKALTAKRELPVRPDRRSAGVMPDIVATSRSYLFALVILICVVLMLIGGGIVLLVMLQP